MKWERDKQLHFISGLGISLVFGIVLILWTPIPVLAASGLGCFLAGAIGWAKEYLYDAARPTEHTVDKNDFHATALGGAVGSILLIGLDAIFQVAT